MDDVTLQLPKNKEINGKFRGHPFRILGLYTLILLVLAAIILILWNFFLVSYERSRVEPVVEEFMERLQNEDSLYTLLEESLTVPDSPYETKKQLLQECYIPAVKEGSLTYRKEYLSNLPENQLVYNIYLDGEKIFRLCLNCREGDAGFSFDTWSIYDVKGYADGFALKPMYEYTLFVPEGAKVRLNGNSATEDLTQQSVSLCLFEEGGVTVDVYRMEGLYTTPDFQVTTADGKSLSAHADGNFLFFSENTEAFYHYSFTVPYGVEVLINGTLLTTANCFSYEKGSYPGGITSPYGMPEVLEYRADYFLSEPTITATYQGKEIHPSVDGTHYVFTYPEDMLYTLRVETPLGASLRVNGVEIPPSQSMTGDMAYRNLADYKSKLDGEFPMTALYELKGLYVQPEVTVTLNGETLSRDGENIDGFSLLYSYLPAASESLKEEQSAFIEKFVRAYVDYVGMGKTNLSNNLYKLQSYILRSSEAYRVVNGSYAELQWVTQYRGMEYQYLNTGDYRPLGDHVYECSASFSVDVSRSGVIKHFEAEFSILVIQSSGKWKVVDFIFQ